MIILKDASELFFNSLSNSADGYPSCFDSKVQYDTWLEMEELCNTKPRSFPCLDCTPSYRNKMISEDRCYLSKLKGVERIMEKA